VKCPLWYSALFFLLSCTTRAAPPPEPLIRAYPTARLVFDRAGTVTPDRAVLLFQLEADNPGAEAVRVQVEDWSALVNGSGGKGEGTLVLEDKAALSAGASGVYPVRLETGLVPGSADLSNGEAELTMDILFVSESGEEIKTRVKTSAVFPLIREPRVRITAIAVKKAELINTRFKVGLRIDNPNSFPVELSAFSYELYNAGRLWANGVKTDVLAIPPEDSAETELLLTMNFINMNRTLLNQVTAMRDIHYRFSGEARVSSGIDYLPQFLMTYDLSGYSEVIE
jgi:LEA14-like dessication related protein